MSDKTGIEWAEATWNPVVGCTHVSAGCDHCYAAREASGRLSKNPTYAGLAAGGKFTGEVRLLPERLEQPLRWKRPRRIFVNSMSDLFHDSVPDEYIARVWQVMASTPQHTYQILTKRHARMRAWVNRCATSPAGWITHDGTDPARAYDGTGEIVGYPELPDRRPITGPRGGKPRYTPQPVAYGWPLPNVWLGVSVENQQWADIRTPALLDTPAAVRFLSCEPLLGPVCLDHFHSPDGHAPGTELPCEAWPRVDWVIVGGESGPGARPMNPQWARDIRDQCVEARVPFLFKQWGEHAPRCRGEKVGEVMQRVGKKTAGRTLDGRTWDEYPAGAA